MTLAAIVPSFKVSQHIVRVVTNLLEHVDTVYVVDDCCPENSGALVTQHFDTPRVKVLRHEKNGGVGAAVLTGYRAAHLDGADILVKVDGDDQMEVSLIPALCAPIIAGEADYTKGNRFYEISGLRQMPPLRVFGNAVLSFFAKASTGYWNSFDPTNGFTALHASLVPTLLRTDIAHRYFFETDVLFRLGTLRAVIDDVPMPARYGDEVSNLKISRILVPFLWGHARNFAKRIFYSYFLRGMSVATLQLMTGLGLFLFGLMFGIERWIHYAAKDMPAPAGTVMLAGLTWLSGLQLLLAFIAHDFANAPVRPVHRSLLRMRQTSGVVPATGDANSTLPTPVSRD